jgi:CheY-like chemotaxis protein
LGHCLDYDVQKEQAISQHTAPQTVLIVDDDAELRAVFSEYIRLQGFHVLEAKDGLEALLQVKRNRPGAIILDLSRCRGSAGSTH